MPKGCPKVAKQWSNQINCIQNVTKLMTYFGHIIVVCLKGERCVQKVTKTCPKCDQTYEIFWAHFGHLLVGTS